jgi:cytidyltransferase-like protein
MEFFRRAPGRPFHLAVFPGTFNPITIAHLELAHAALRIVDEVVFVLPRSLPHKEYVGASFEERIALLTSALAAEPRFSLATVDHGLFVEIARDCRTVYDPGLRLSFLCGRDAAERIANWDYGRPGVFAETLQEFGEVSATEIRDRIARCEPWEHLVPESVREEVAKIYRRGA